jgi:glycosyltransferase involved in cell wall biosynthesis
MCGGNENASGGTMKVALVHYWLVGMRGGEAVLEALCEMYPSADIFTHVVRPDRISETIKKHAIKTSFIARLPFADRYYQKYLPLMPLALEQFDLRDYDLVISSESGPAKGVLTSPDTIHICYCHTPMRYVWNMYLEYQQSAGVGVRHLMPWIMYRMRQWDFISAARVDAFVANSENVARRIRKFYRREATVIHPPVDVQAFQPASKREDFYLYVGQLVSYKRVDLAIDACNRLGRSLVIIGDGEQRAALQKRAGPTIQFLGRTSPQQLRDSYARCRAVLFPGEEDFGIVPLEASASGTPVIAFAKGGALETVVDRVTGVFFDEQSSGSLIDAIVDFEKIEHRFQTQQMVAHAAEFSKEQFKQQIAAFIKEQVSASRVPNPPLRKAVGY